MTDELKACPFCGARQLTDAEAGETLPYQGEYRACDECGCVSRDWNHRPIEDAQAAEIERLNAALDEIIQEHDMYCENHIGVSNHAYKLAAIARAARDGKREANE